MLRNLPILSTTVRSQHSVVTRFNNVMKEFFDDEANFGKTELRPRHRPGRSWSEEELRLKSNPDLHKLWYVCLKERNMLITMKRAHLNVARNMPNPERIDKVEETMIRIENVAHERNDAVFRLETGESVNPKQRTVTSFAGFTYKKLSKEHLLPNTEEKMYETPYLNDDAYTMQKLWNEKEFMKKKDRLDDISRKEKQSEEMRRFKKGGKRVFNKN